MSFLQYSYLLLDLLFIGLAIGLSFQKIWLLPIFLVAWLIYPFIYEPFLWVFFFLKSKILPRSRTHVEMHLGFAKLNSLVYDEVYNISAMGLEKKSPFDAEKYRRVMNFLSESQFNIFEKTNKPGWIDYELLYQNNSFRHLILLSYAFY